MIIGGLDPGSRRVLDPRSPEQQRLEHLVLGQPRPAPKSVGKGRGKRKLPIALDPAVDVALALREAWSHKQGTPETHEHAARAGEGAMARLYRSGAISAAQLQYAADIVTVFDRIRSDVQVRTASLETRVDSTRLADDLWLERVGQVRAEVAYGRWRLRVRTLGPVDAILDVIAGDAGLVVVARRYAMHNRRMRALLCRALDLWGEIFDDVARHVGRRELLEAHAAVLS